MEVIARCKRCGINVEMILGDSKFICSKCGTMVVPIKKIVLVNSKGKDIKPEND